MRLQRAILVISIRAVGIQTMETLSGPVAPRSVSFKKDRSLAGHSIRHDKLWILKELDQFLSTKWMLKWIRISDVFDKRAPCE